jgi:hypothetical protein
MKDTVDPSVSPATSYIETDYREADPEDAMEQPHKRMTSVEIVLGLALMVLIASFFSYMVYGIIYK